MKTQSAGFDGWTERSIEMLKRTAWAANETKIFMGSVSELDRDTLEKLVGELKPTVEKAKQDVAILVEELRTFNSEINAVREQDFLIGDILMVGHQITAEVSSLVVSVAAQQHSVAQQRSTVEQQRIRASQDAEQAYALGNAALVGTGVGLAVSAALFPLLLPLVLLTGGVAAGAAGNRGDSTSPCAAEPFL